MLKYYFPFYKNKFCFSARLLFFPYLKQLQNPRKIDFGGVPLKQNIRENARKLVITGAKRALDFFAHAHICIHVPQNRCVGNIPQILRGSGISSKCFVLVFCLIFIYQCNE